MRADRLLAIVLTLQARGRVRAGDLARELEVSERTIYRDLDALTAAGVPVYAERGPGGGVALLEGYQTRVSGLSEPELRALSLAALPGPLAELNAHQGALETALLKLSASLPALYRSSVDVLRRRVHIDPARWFQPREHAPHLPLLQEAVVSERRLRVVYRRKDGSETTRLIDPLGLVAKAGLWYVVVRSAGGLRAYRASRFLEATPVGERFEYPRDFDLVAYWNEWCQRFERTLARLCVRVRVAPAAREPLQRMFGEGILERFDAAPPDPRGRRTLEFTFDHLEQARASLLGLGALLEVIDPPELRDDLRETARAVMELYSSQAAVTRS
ncbi:putative DNA-binding transcriptional regulator YafY [Deinobacterium chartae]|uniref:Putative DNA-binding transcriptional regulator YafY n=1 Tax=Deinobacterium chartae TaxID=521158 RepID=A0A841I110_9DEIO|nr:WYL domain-containing protein [Deinobacterium chartae]MBB6098776.1 putative DNA-binding transcriptional regulator YafY [Deinobacterium chartae]